VWVGPDRRQCAGADAGRGGRARAGRGRDWRRRAGADAVRGGRARVGQGGDRSRCAGADAVRGGRARVGRSRDRRRHTGAGGVGPAPRAFAPGGRRAGRPRARSHIPAPGPASIGVRFPPPEDWRPRWASNVRSSCGERWAGARRAGSGSRPVSAGAGRGRPARRARSHIYRGPISTTGTSAPPVGPNRPVLLRRAGGRAGRGGRGGGSRRGGGGGRSPGAAVAAGPVTPLPENLLDTTSELGIRST
jgi:hypothetical protein